MATVGRPYNSPRQHLWRGTTPALNYTCSCQVPQGSKDAGAFNTLFGEALLRELNDAEHIYLLRLAVEEGRSRHVDKMTETMLDDDYEHGLCEWVKARRGKASYVKQSQSKKLVRRQALT
jgi:hypothetical protein